MHSHTGRYDHVVHDVIRHMDISPRYDTHMPMLKSAVDVCCVIVIAVRDLASNNANGIRAL